MKRVSLFIALIAIAVLAACSGKGRNDAQSVQETDIDSAQEFSLPPVVDLFQFNNDYSSPFMVDYRIWGWSRDGKVAYSVTGHDGGITSLYFNIVDYFSADSQAVNYWENFDDFNTDEDGYHLDENGNRIDFNDIYRDFYNICIEQGIEFVQSGYRRLPIVHNNRTNNVNLALAKQEMDGVDIVESYTVIVEAHGERFVHTAPQEGYTLDAFLLGYFLSPFENRALIAMGKSVFGGYIQDFFLGCDLDIGFTAMAGTVAMPPQSYVGKWGDEYKCLTIWNIFDDEDYKEIDFSWYILGEISAMAHGFIEENKIRFYTREEGISGTMEFHENSILLAVEKSENPVINVGATYLYSGKIDE